MKKSVLLTIVALMCMAMFAGSASALVVTPTPVWNINCDSTSAQTLGTIQFLQSYPGELNNDLSQVNVGPNAQGSMEAATWTIDANESSAILYPGSPAWDVAGDRLDLVVRDTAPAVLEISDFAAFQGNLTTSEGFTVRNQRVATTGDGITGDDCTDTKCLVTADITISYTAGVHFKCVTTKTALIATSDAMPDLCHTTLKYPYVVNNQDDSSYVTALVVTSNMSTTCIDTAFDTVDFYAWDEGGNFRGHRGPYILNPDGQVVIVVSDPDDGSANDWGATADAIKHTTWENTWWDLAAGTWNPWLNADGNTTGRGQVVAIINQNHAEGYQFLFSLGDSGIAGFGTTFALKDLTNYMNTESETDTMGAYIRSILHCDPNAYAEDNAHTDWGDSSWYQGYAWSNGAYADSRLYNMGIVSVDSLGNKVRSIAGITEAYYH